MLYLGWIGFLNIRLLSLVSGRQSLCKHLRGMRLSSREVPLSIPLHCFATFSLIAGRGSQDFCGLCMRSKILPHAYKTF